MFFPLVTMEGKSDTPFDASVRVEDLRSAMALFVSERGWLKFHTPRNLVLALVGEVGELAELFQWRGEVAPGLPEWSSADRTHLGEELADCLLYLVRLSDRCGVDLPAAALRKMELNRAKYPVERCFGSSAKYTAYTASPQPPAADARTEQQGAIAAVAAQTQDVSWRRWAPVAGAAAVFAAASVAARLFRR